MTDLQRALAKAVHQVSWASVHVTWMNSEDAASAILATEPMQDYQREQAEKDRLAAIGAAVDRLADAVEWELRGGPDGAPAEAWNSQVGTWGRGNTIIAAIAAALGEDDE